MSLGRSSSAAARPFIVPRTVRILGEPFVVPELGDLAVAVSRSFQLSAFFGWLIATRWVVRMGGGWGNVESALRFVREETGLRLTVQLPRCGRCRKQWHVGVDELRARLDAPGLEAIADEVLRKSGLSVAPFVGGLADGLAAVCGECATGRVQGMLGELVARAVCDCGASEHSPASAGPH